MSYTIVGVIGHIDHGKTSLVAALTGKDTDTHPEEKRRGITIDLGFASFTEGSHQFALIDAPGHQKYIGNLLAGVSGIDVGLLVVAVDQGIQEQTLEHASILHTLGVEKLIVVLSRIDLATEEARDELQEELEIFLDDFGFTDVPMIPVSSVRNVGIDQLKTRLCELAATLPQRDEGTYFRMPVDRVFTMPGRGCVIAGTVWTGQVSNGDSLQLASTGTLVRVRNVEVHGISAENSRVGCRTALNIAGISANDISRGDEVLQPDIFEPSRFLLVELKTFPQIPEIKCPATLQLHTAAMACSARITGTRRLQPAQSAVVVLEAEVPVVATFGQKCLLRLPYPVGTVAGGTVVAAIGDESRRSRKLIEFGERIALAEGVERLIAWVDFLGEVEVSEAWCETKLGIPAIQMQDLIEEAIRSERVLQTGEHTRLVSQQTGNLVRKKLIELLTQQAEDSHDAWAIQDSVIRQAEGFASREFIQRTVDELVVQKKLVRVGRRIALATDENSLSKKQISRMQQIVDRFRDQRTPPTLKDVAAELELPLDTVRSLARFAVQTGLLLDTGHDLLIEAVVFHEMCGELQSLFAATPELSVADIRDRWQVTRKHAIPFLEYCDRNDVTVRVENLRTAGPRLPEFAEQTVS